MALVFSFGNRNNRDEGKNGQTNYPKTFEEYLLVCKQHGIKPQLDFERFEHLTTNHHTDQAILNTDNRAERSDLFELFFDDMCDNQGSYHLYQVAKLNGQEKNEE